MTASLSGFPEWLPQDRQFENIVIDACRVMFELNGFAPVETRAVETVDTLLRKGDIDKEVYGLHRLADAAKAAEAKPKDQLALHFDLTVPFARFVTENAGKLDFPFRRYQIQKVWRGERPQEGRYREFTQADIDVVGMDELPAHYDIELPVVMAGVFSRLARYGLPEITIRVSNRKLAEGFYRGIGLEDPAAVLQTVDKLDKIGPEKVATLLQDNVGATQAQATQCLELASIKGTGPETLDKLASLGVEHDLLTAGMAELQAVLAGADDAGHPLVADLSIARGLDYYTGTVYESTMAGFEQHGSVCSGGRYDALCQDKKHTYPGVGISFGLSRAVGLLLGHGYTSSRKVPSCVVVALPTEEHRPQANRVARTLRSRGIATVVAPAAAKFGKQIKYADKLGVPYVWFMEDSGHQVKDIRTGDQEPAEPDTWTPELVDVAPHVVAPADPEAASAEADPA